MSTAVTDERFDELARRLKAMEPVDDIITAMGLKNQEDLRYIARSRGYRLKRRYGALQDVRTEEWL